MRDDRALALTGRLNDDLEAVVSRGVREADFEQLLRHHHRWILAEAADRFRRFRRAHDWMDLSDAEQAARIGLWRALRDFRWICPRARCRHATFASQREWARHAKRHPGIGGPLMAVGRYVRLTLKNRTDHALRPAYAVARGGSTEQAPPAEHVVAAASTVRVLDDAEQPVHEVAVAPVAEEQVIAAEIVDQARPHLSPAALRMLARLVVGYTEREAAAEEPGAGSAGGCAARRARNFLRAAVCVG